MQDRDRTRLADAVRFALEVHAGQTRKGKAVPYVSHLLQVTGLVLEYGGDAELAAAAVLHDAVEDCEGVDVEMLRDRFGAGIAEVVAQCSDLLPGDTPKDKSPWLARKQRYVACLARADARTCLVAACDKLHNLRSLVADLREEGCATLERFEPTPEQMRGYFEAVYEALRPGLPTGLDRELGALLDELRRFVPGSSFG